MKNFSTENYLKAVYKNTEEEKLVSITNMSEELNLSKAAITDMAKKLSEKGLLEYYRYKGIKLTKEGEILALKVLRKHRLWEMFLHKVLNLSWTEIHNEAEMLEHSTSTFLTDKIDEYLGYPEFDPHGDPIPNYKLEVPRTEDQMELSKGSENGQYIISRITENDVELFDYLSQIGIKLGSKITILKKLNFDGSIVVKQNKNTFTLSKQMAKSIYIKKVK